jgi:hypothetical protein
MPDYVYKKIIDDLVSIHYDREIVWGGYCEPLAHESIYGRVAQARAALPNALLALISNGDYLNRQTVKQLEVAKLDRLLLDLYLPKGKEEDESELSTALQRFVHRTGLSPIKYNRHGYVISGSCIKITMRAPHFTQESMFNRAGLMEIPKTHAYRRRAVCLEPIRHVVIDFDGKGMLCCETRTDAPQHQSAIIGDLSLPDYSLFHCYRDGGSSRKALIIPGPKGGVCLSCDQSGSNPDRLARNNTVAALIERLGLSSILGKAFSYRGSRFDGVSP